jgi:uncharacterized membrane protein YadS
MKREWIRPFFMIAAAYDFILGVLFLFAYPAVYDYFHVTPPNHPAYIQFAAAVVAIFGIGFWFVARAPERNRDIIKLGVLLKLTYSTVVLAWWFKGQMPAMWVPFAWFDLAFLAAFLASLRTLPAAAAH